ncbi:splicing factor, Prp19-binding domain-containing protein [Lophiotrema nucula]|uniref:Splicing factor, Prp19-binding domain-containing protein n=1 Tax=Lophiotrema nucula TaxID=690887 RepID=A0A6A5ZTV2_9PLEO|nr:splicing factor, Prp19-binding domain-containing protein [Lophiotrema nucula]
MPPPKAKKMTAQPVRTRHFAGKPAAAEPEQPSSSEESESEDERPKRAPKPKPLPKASSFPKAALKSNLAARQKAQAAGQQIDEAEFETESEEGSGEEGSESGSGSEEDSSEEESSSEEEAAPRKLLRPVFLKKGQRNQTGPPVKSEEEIAAGEEKRKQEDTRAVVEAQVRQRQEEKLARQRAWDDDVVEADFNAIDDTDGVDPEAEYAAWKLRELKRIRREREKIEEAEAERAEIERRRNLSAAEREAEDREFIEKQKEERADRGDMNFMQKYFHKGAFYQEDLKELGIDRRNVMGARFEDSTNREVLPEYMQIRDMTKLGKKGRTRYKDMKSEDTGRWGDPGDRRKRDDYGVDERFRGDSYRGDDRDREGPSGANAKPLGERKRFGEESDRDGKRARVDDR